MWWIVAFGRACGRFIAAVAIFHRASYWVRSPEWAVEWWCPSVHQVVYSYQRVADVSITNSGYVDIQKSMSTSVVWVTVDTNLHVPSAAIHIDASSVQVWVTVNCTYASSFFAGPFKKFFGQVVLVLLVCNTIVSAQFCLLWGVFNVETYIIECMCNNALVGYFIVFRKHSVSVLITSKRALLGSRTMQVLCLY